MNALIIGIASTILLFAGLFSIPDNIISICKKLRLIVFMQNN